MPYPILSSEMAAERSAASMDVSAQHSMDLLLQVPMAAAFALLASINLLQVLLPGPVSRRLSAAVRWATHNTVLATVFCTLAAGMAVAVVATGAQLRYLYLSKAPVAGAAGTAAHNRGMSATAGLSAIADQGEKLWTTLLLGLSDIVLCVNIWGFAREQQKTAQAQASTKAMRRQAEGLKEAVDAGGMNNTVPGGAAGDAAPAGAPSDIDRPDKKLE